MPVELELDRSGTAALPPPAGTPARRPSRWRPDRFELAVFGLFALLSLWTVTLDVVRASTHGLVWTGTDGIYIVDQMQYLAWIRDASQHGMSANLFVLHHTPADYFQPGVMLSGMLVALGMPAWLALLLWKPVAVVAMFLAAQRYLQRSLADLYWGRRAALVLTLFFGCFSVVYGLFGVVGDLMPVFSSWGYNYGLLAVALMIFALLGYERAREAESLRWSPGLLGALAALLHPWQGELLVLIVLGSELLTWRTSARRPPRLSLPVLTIVLTGLPLVYYELLGRTDASWRLARVASKHGFSIWTLLLALAPLLVMAAFAYRPRPRSFLETITRVWPLAALLVYAVSASSVSATPLHAFDGITLPLAVLAVQAARRPRLRRLTHARGLAIAAVALGTVPATGYLLGHVAALTAPTAGNPNFIRPSEARALRYLKRARAPGGVLTRFYLGTVVPAQTGRRTFVGDCLWSQPDCGPRASYTQLLLDGRLSPTQSRALVAGSRARFVLSDCQVRNRLGRTLAPLIVSVHRFGCATVYELRPEPAPASQAGL